MAERLFEANGTLAILLGASDWSRAKLDSSSAFSNSAADFESYLRSVKGLRLPQSQIKNLFDSRLSSSDQIIEIRAFLDERLAKAKEQGRSPSDLIVYYSGHGFFGHSTNDYFLMIRSSMHGLEFATSLNFKTLATCITDTARRMRRHIILDCCFAAAAADKAGGASFQAQAANSVQSAVLNVDAALPRRGTLVLAASSGANVARFDPKSRHTMFSGALHKVLAQGAAAEGPFLSFETLHAEIWEELRDAHGSNAVRPELHSPDQSEGDLRRIPAFPNPAVRPAPKPMPPPDSVRFEPASEPARPPAQKARAISARRSQATHPQRLSRRAAAKAILSSVAIHAKAAPLRVLAVLRSWRAGISPPASKDRPKRSITYWAAAAAISGAVLLLGFFAIFAVDLPDTSKLYDVARQPSISYLDRSGAPAGLRGSQYAAPVDLDKLPPYVPKAFIAVEDRWFYWHPGFNPWSMAQGAIRSERGGSTITQQLARNLFLTPNQNYRRKIQELILAMWLEARFSKKEILALYMNRVYFGAGAYGIEAAAQRYFGKAASELTISESALLAGLMKGPTRYSPIASTERSARRATLVMDEMVRTGAITQDQWDEAVRTPVRVNPTLASQRAQYFIDWVDDQVRSLVGEPTEDLVVETTLDLPIQAAAEQALGRGVAAAKSQGVEQAALVAIDGEGRIRAYVGGASYMESQFDNITGAKRRMGAAFMPFVYLTAMEAGRTPNVPVVDEPVKIGNWEPRNYTNDFKGPMTLQTALAQSINTVAARLANEVGTGNVAATARRVGITSEIPLDPSMALGAVEVSPLEVAQAYIPFANGGFLAKGYGITRIRTAGGRILYDHNVDTAPRQAVIGSPALQYMNQMMRAVIVSGTGTNAMIDGYDLAGKTGVTADRRSASFVGYTGGFVAVVWLGRETQGTMTRVTGGGAPAVIWNDFMAAALPRLKTQPIPGGPAPEERPPMDEMGQIIDGVGDLMAKAQ